MPVKFNLVHIKQAIDYDWFLPFIARLPLSIGQRIAQMRGWII